MWPNGISGLQVVCRKERRLTPLPSINCLQISLKILVSHVPMTLLIFKIKVTFCGMQPNVFVLKLSYIPAIVLRQMSLTLSTIKCSNWFWRQTVKRKGHIRFRNRHRSVSVLYLHYYLMYNDIIWTSHMVCLYSATTSIISKFKRSRPILWLLDTFPTLPQFIFNCNYKQLTCDRKSTSINSGL